MKRIKSISEKRLIVEAKVNDKKAYFLVDTGASLALMDYDQRKKYELSVGKSYHGTIVGAGGEMRNVKYCNTFVNLEDKVIPQFLLADMREVVKSIKRETGIEILGIISMPQCKMFGLSLDCNDNEIILE